MSEVITGNKISAHFDRVFGSQMPITADVFLTNYCNNNCGYCTYRRWEWDSSARSMSLQNFVRYALRLKELGVQGIILTGGGEPTIAKDFEMITWWLETHGFKYGINTNFNVYKECNPEYLKVSLDAWNEDSYQKIRGVKAYEQTRDNIKRFAEYKKNKTRLGIQLLAKSREQVRRFYDANQDLPVDYIVMRPVESTYGSYYAEEEHHPEDIVNAIRKLRECDDRIVMNYKWHLLGKKYPSCIGQWSQIALNEVGEVMYCCHKPYQIIGHVMDEDILEKKKNAMTDMNMCDVPCRLSGVNFDLQSLQKPKPLHAEFI